MQNKWYVIGLLVPAVLLAWWSVSLAMGDSGMMFLVPGALAAALGVAAYRVAKAASFSPASQARWDTGQTAGMSRWLKHRADDAADAQAAKDAAARDEERPPTAR